MHKIKYQVLVLSALLFSAVSHAQVKFRAIAPGETQEGLRMVHTPHLAAEPAAGNNRHQLFVMIPGTNGKAADFRTIDSCFAAMGYYVITPDYVNTVITTACSKSEDSTCFDHFRQEIMFGTAVSDKVEVDSANSLVNRVTKLLVYLAVQDKGWREFVHKGKVQWDKVIAGGHSQGAGHAAYFGKQFRLRGVLMFSGPQDYLQYFNAPAHWQREQGRTPVNRYYAFLHTGDPFNYQYQVADVSAVSHQAVTDTTMVQPGMPVRPGKSILVTDVDRKDKHGSTLGTEFTAVWKYMISSATSH
ncbi:BPSS1187 family protein [Chitinophaga sp.]|uniref:BPSS1187 family protein n=1 Tax=Chitinophaga sp. TaxID=1869181 RepID=UPI002F93634A